MFDFEAIPDNLGGASDFVEALVAKAAHLAQSASPGQPCGGRTTSHFASLGDGTSQEDSTKQHIRKHKQIAKEEKSLVLFPTDWLSDVYSAFANDGSLDMRQREAAMLFSVAEDHIDVGVDHNEALRVAEEALTLFTRLEDEVGIADSFRLIVHAHLLKVETMHFRDEPFDKDERIETLRQAEAVAREGLARFDTSDNQRGQAAMMLSLAEVTFREGGRTARMGAASMAGEARTVLGEVGDGRLEARSLLTLSMMHLEMHQLKEALEDAENALALFQGIGDKKGEAAALRSVAAVYMEGSLADAGLKAAKKALAVYRTMGDKRLQAAGLHFIAQWYLLKEHSQEALKNATEALELIREVGWGLVWEASALDLVVIAHMQGYQASEGVDVAREALETFRERGDKRQVVFMLEVLIFAHLADFDNSEEASRVAQEGASVCQELGDQRWESIMLHLNSYVHYRAERFDEALQAAEKSVAISKSVGIKKDEALLLVPLSTTLNQKGKHDDALEVAKRARELSQGEDEKGLEASAVLAMAWCFAVSGRLSRAIETAMDASAMFKEEGDVREASRALKQAVIFHRAEEDYESAVSVATTRLGLVQELGDKRAQARAHLLIANLHMGNEKFKEAARAAMEGRQVARVAGHRKGEIEMLHTVVEANIEQLFSGKQDKGSHSFKVGCDKTLRSAKEAVVLSQMLKSKDLEAISQYWLSQTYMAADRLEQAEQAAQASASFFELFKDFRGQACALAIVGQVHFAQREPEKGMEALNEALNLMKKAGEARGEENVNKLIEKLTGVARQAAAAAAVQMPLAVGADVPVMPMPGASSTAVVVEYAPPDPKTVQDRIGDMVANMTGSDLEDFAGDTPFMDVGMDSLASVEFRVALQKEFGITLPTTVMFNYPTPGGLTNYIVEECTQKSIPWGK